MLVNYKMKKITPQDFGEEQMKQSHSHPAQCLAGGSAG